VDKDGLLTVASGILITGIGGIVSESAGFGTSGTVRCLSVVNANSASSQTFYSSMQAALTATRFIFNANNTPTTTGNIVDFRVGDVTKAYFDKDGYLTTSRLTNPLNSNAYINWTTASVLNLSGAALNAAGSSITGGFLYVGSGNIEPANSDFLRIRGSVLDGASAISLKIGNANTLVTTGAKIVSFYSDSFVTEKAYINKDGGGSFNGIVNSAGMRSDNYYSATVAPVILGGQVADSSSAISVKILSFQSLVTTGAKIVSFYSDNGITEKASIDKDGLFTAVSKSFLIPHPTKPGKQLRHGSLEGPEHGVYVRGRASSPYILLPEYWVNLVDMNSVTVQLTPIGQHRRLAVVSASSTMVEIASDGPIDCYYFIQGDRIDIPKLQVEE
jgi:hypothetical protein